MIRFAAMLCTLEIGLLLSSAAFAQDPWIETDTDHNAGSIFISSGRKPARIAWKRIPWSKPFPTTAPD